MLTLYRMISLHQKLWTAKLLMDSNGTRTVIYKPVYLCLLCFLDFCPGVSKADGTVKDKLVFGTIGIDTEIAQPFELESTKRRSTSK